MVLLRMFKNFLRKLQLNRQNIFIMSGTQLDSLSNVGQYTYVGYNCLITKAKIGRYCSIANNVSIGPGEHDISKVSTSSLFYENPFAELTKKDVAIGHDVWIGANSVIRRGVTIGDGAVIGANSFVNTDVPDFAIFAGTPAKLIKFRFDEVKRREISALKWWELNLEDAKREVRKVEV